MAAPHTIKYIHSTAETIKFVNAYTFIKLEHVYQEMLLEIIHFQQVLGRFLPKTKNLYLWEFILLNLADYYFNRFILAA